MKILQVTAPGEFVVKETPTPSPGADEVLIRVEAVTTCPQWDLHLHHNEPMFVGHRFHYPYTAGQPGHEATGTIEALGPGVTEFQIGDRVSMWRDAGHDRLGCYAQYVVANAALVIKVPPELPFEATASVELAMCVGATFLRLKSMDALRGKRVAISGLGPAGLVAAQLAKAEGAVHIVGFDLNADRRAYAKTVAVDQTFDPREVTEEEFPVRPGPVAIETAVDCVGAKGSVEFLMDRTAQVVALFGVQREAYTFAPHHYDNLCLCGYPGHSRQAAEYVVGLMGAGLLDLRPLVTHNLTLEEYGEGVRLLERQEAIKVCFWPWR